jgi:DNA-binding NarL/FixJ family response regulator
VIEELTVGEQLVANLVAQGWTNQEVADELSIRPKTVEWTLTKVYRKLDLRSRTELALMVAGSNPGVSLDTARNADQDRA